MYGECDPGEKHFKKGGETAEEPIWADAVYFLPKGVKVIDIDCHHIDGLSQAQIIEFIRRAGIKTQYVLTDRGVHLYYLDAPEHPRVFNGVCAAGFPIETKTASNTPNGVCVKRNGVMREIVNEGVFEVLPWYFKKGKTYQNMVGLGEGGRNNALYQYHLNLSEHPDDSEWLSRFVNEVLFDQPLDEKEFQSVTRGHHGNGGASEYSQAETIKNEFRCVNYQGSVWWWNGHEYITDIEKKDDRLRKMIYLRNPECKSYFVDEITKQIADRADTITRSDFPIRLRNGILDEGKFTEFKDFREFTPYHIDANYDPNAPDCPEVTDYLNQITGGDESYLRLLEEIIAYPLITDPERMAGIAKFFVFRGDGANGKSTLLKILRKIYQPRNCASLSIKQVADKAYHVSLLGKLVNLGDDIEPDAINNAEMKLIKNVCTADIIETRRLYQQGMSVRITAKLFFTANSDVRTFEKGYAYQRRVLWLPMFNTITAPDPLFVKKLTTDAAISHWLRLMVSGYERLYENCVFTKCDKVDEYNKEYHLDNNYMEKFVADTDIDQSIIGRSAKEVEGIFDLWNDDPKRPFNTKQLKDVLRPKGIGVGRKNTIEGVRRVFMYQSETTQKIL